MATRILIVDDSAGFRAVVREMLEAEGLVVVAEAEDGAGGLVAAAAHAPDAVLLDVRLPDMTGFEVADRLAGHGGKPRVVLTSSSDRNELAPLLARPGAPAFLPKDELSGVALAELLR